MNVARIALIAGMLLLNSGLSAAPVVEPVDGTMGMDAEQAQRYWTLTEELRCLVCQNQNIAESNAPLARDLRVEVRRMILAGQSDAEIKQYMIEHFGDFVLYRPPFKVQTLLLWSGPPLLLLLAGIVAWRLTRRSIPAAVSNADEARLAELLVENTGNGNGDPEPGEPHV